jgi:putative transposase
MKRKRHTEEEAARKFRVAESTLAAGASVAQVCRKLGVSEATFHRWRQRHGQSKDVGAKRGRDDSTQTDFTQRLLELEKENRRLKQLVGELSLEIALLKDLLEERS